MSLTKRHAVSCDRPVHTGMPGDVAVQRAGSGRPRSRWASVALALMPLLLGTGVAGDLGAALALPGRGSVDAAKDGMRPREPVGRSLPLQPARHIAFETDEGTWMSVDVAPDGKRLAFDMLGDLYTLDRDGGRAVPIRRGMAMDAQPTWSPDGRWIAFVSDASGAENLWVVRPDGSDARQVSFGDDDTVLVSPAWAPDGRSVYVSRFLWSLNAYELWRYGLDGSEARVVPIRVPGRSERWSSRLPMDACWHSPRWAGCT